MNIKAARKKEHGSAVLIVLVLLFIMVLLISASTSSVIRLRREVKLVEKQQLQRLASSPVQSPSR